MPLVEIVIALALIELVVFAMLVGRARGKYNVPAPATTGNDIFERYYRVQMNTIELLVIFIPSIMLFGKYISQEWAAALGLVFIVGRFLFLQGYVSAPEKRGSGFILSFIPTIILLLGGLGGAAYKYLVES